MAFRFEHPEATAPGTWRSPSMSPCIVSQRGACRAHWHSPDTRVCAEANLDRFLKRDAVAW